MIFPAINFESLVRKTNFSSPCPLKRGTTLPSRERRYLFLAP
jgi:hypothetical protein